MWVLSDKEIRRLLRRELEGKAKDCKHGSYLRRHYFFVSDALHPLVALHSMLDGGVLSRSLLIYKQACFRNSSGLLNFGAKNLLLVMLYLSSIIDMNSWYSGSPLCSPKVFSCWYVLRVTAADPPCAFRLSCFSCLVSEAAQPAAGYLLRVCVLLIHERNWMSCHSKDSQLLSYVVTVASARQPNMDTPV